MRAITILEYCTYLFPKQFTVNCRQCLFLNGRHNQTGNKLVVCLIIFNLMLVNFHCFSAHWPSSRFWTYVNISLRPAVSFNNSLYPVRARIIFKNLNILVFDDNVFVMHIIAYFIHISKEKQYLSFPFFTENGKIVPASQVFINGVITLTHVTASSSKFSE